MRTDRDLTAPGAGAEERPAQAARRLTRAPRGRSLGLVWAATCAFLALLAVLAWQMSSGRDPALRARLAATPPPPRRILLRRVIERRVIIHLPPTAPPQRSSASQQLGAGASPFSSAVTRTS